MNNEQIPPPPLGEPKGSTIRHIRPISPIRLIGSKDTLPPLGGTEGDSNIIYNVAMNAKKQPPGIAMHSFLRNSGSAEVTCTRQWTQKSKLFCIALHSFLRNFANELGAYGLSAAQ